MRNKLGKMWRITVAMTLVIALVPVLSLMTPTAVLGSTNGSSPEICDATVTVCPVVIPCNTLEVQKNFSVKNDGDCPICRFMVFVPTGYGDVTGVTKPAGWNFMTMEEQPSNWTSWILWYVDTGDCILSGETMEFFIDIPAPSSAGEYWWDWKVWNSRLPCAQYPCPSDPACDEGSARQSVDCDDPDVSTECATDCTTWVDDLEVYQRGDGPYTIYAIATDPENNLDTVKLWWNEEQGCDPEGWNKVTMNRTANPNEYEAQITDKPNSTDIYYKVVATDLAGHVAESQCCHFHVDKGDPVVEVVVSEECFAPGQPVPITVNVTCPYDGGHPDLEDLGGNVPEVKVNGSDAYVSGPTGSYPTWDFVYQYTGEGSDDCDHAVVATIYDCIGNEGSGQASFEVDGVAPPCPEVSGEACPLENKLWWDPVVDAGAHCPGGDVDYNIYRGLEGEEKSLIATEEEAYPDDPWVDHTGGLVDGETYCYEVRAVDERNNESSGCEPECLTYFEGIPPEDYAFDICAGWNMISLPKIPFNPDTLVVLADVLNEEGEVVWGYDPDNDPDTGWHYRDYEGSGELALMVDGQGYWLYSLRAGTVTGKGWDLAVGPAVPPLYPVKAGWNLIGFKSQVPMPTFAYLWKLLVTDISAQASLQAGFNLWEEWWEEFGYADWIAWGGCSVGDWECDPGPCEELWYKWWLVHGEAGWYEYIWRTGGASWLEVEAGLEIALDNMQVIVLGYDCDCHELSFYPVGTMEPGLGYWLYSPDDREILPMPMEWLWFLSLMGGGCGPGGCFS